MNKTLKKIFGVLCMLLIIGTGVFVVQLIRFQEIISKEAKRAYGITNPTTLSLSVETFFSDNPSYIGLYSVSAELTRKMSDTEWYCKKYAETLKRCFLVRTLKSPDGRVIEIENDIGRCDQSMMNMAMGLQNLQNFANRTINEKTDINTREIRENLTIVLEQSRQLDLLIEEGGFPESVQTRDDVAVVLSFFLNAEQFAEQFYRATVVLGQSINR
ncbi:MAG: hypothetical protein J5493_06215 [Lachnospiraceae bacterium]|nr:hypothetical protein [Lachnospiraceae bacterium]